MTRLRVELVLNGKRYELTGGWRGAHFDWRAECEGRLVAASFDLGWVRQRCEADCARQDGADRARIGHSAKYTQPKQPRSRPTRYPTMGRMRSRLLARPSARGDRRNGSGIDG